MEVSSASNPIFSISPANGVQKRALIIGHSTRCSCDYGVFGCTPVMRMWYGHTLRVERPTGFVVAVA
eukprot:2536073-Prymnesium_polylepis.1